MDNKQHPTGVLTWGHVAMKVMENKQYELFNNNLLAIWAKQHNYGPCNTGVNNSTLNC